MKRTILACLLCLTCLLCFSAFVSPYIPATAQTQNTTGKVLQNANLRAGPGTNYVIVGSVKAGQAVTVVNSDSTGKWYQLDNGKWIAAFLVQVTATAPATSSDTTGNPITVVGWNTELNDADVKVIAKRLADFQDIDVWGLSEINRADSVPTLEAGAEVGENADYASVLSESGGGDKLLAIYDTTRFDLIKSWELNEINTTGTARAALVLDLREKSTGLEFLFVTNHLYRTRDDQRYKQARLLNEWAAKQTLPVIDVGDHNFDWDLKTNAHDKGYDLMTKDSKFVWVRPEKLVTTQCSGWPCKYNSVLDFVFVAGPAESWRSRSEIIVTNGDFPETATTSDHRPIMAQFWPTGQAVTTPILVPTATIAPVIVQPTATAQQPLLVPTATAVQSTQVPATANNNLVITEVNKRAEYVVIRNDGANVVNLGGWTLLSERGNQSCPLGGEIAPGASLTIYSTQGNGGFNCNFGSEIWNNSKDDNAILIAPNGTIVFTFDS